MTFITTLASVFFANYILSLIINALKIRNGRRWFIGITSVFELGATGYYTYLTIRNIVLMVQYDYGASEIAEMLLGNGSYVLAILAGYLVSLFLSLRGVKVFKSRRQRAFDRENEGKASVSQIALDIVIFAVGAVLLGVSFAVLALVGLNTYFWCLLGSGIAIVIFGIVVTVLGSNHLTSEEKTEKKSKGKDVLFFVKTEDVFFTYIYKYNKETALKDGLGKIGQDFILTDFGELKLQDERYSVIGIMPTDFDYSLLKEITLEKDRRDYKEILSNVSKYQRVLITADENMQVLEVKNIK